MLFHVSLDDLRLLGCNQSFLDSIKKLSDRGLSSIAVLTEADVRVGNSCMPSDIRRSILSRYYRNSNLSGMTVPLLTIKHVPSNDPLPYLLSAADDNWTAALREELWLLKTRTDGCLSSPVCTLLNARVMNGNSTYRVKLSGDLSVGDVLAVHYNDIRIGTTIVDKIWLDGVENQNTDHCSDLVRCVIALKDNFEHSDLKIGSTFFLIPKE